MPRWEINLRLSHPFSDIELDHWLDLFDSPVCKVTKGEDANYYLTARRFEKLIVDANEVRESARKLKTMMIAFAEIELDIDYQSIEGDDEENGISSVLERLGGNSNITVYPKSANVYTFAGKATVVITDNEGNIVPHERQKRWYDYYLNRCDDWIDKTVVFKALDYFAKKTMPRTLRLTYEAIGEDEGDKEALLKNKWVSEPELNDFTGFLNYHDLGGQELHVKHTRDKKAKKKKASKKVNYRPKMNLDQARTFLAQRLLKNWLIKKRQIYKLG